MCAFCLCKNEADEFEIYLKTLHPDRAHHYLTWKWISSVAYRLIDDNAGDDEYKEKVMGIFLNWSSAYPYYDEQENIKMVEMWERYHRRTMGFIYDLVKFDNPDIEIKSAKEAELQNERASLVPDWDLPDIPPDSLEQNDEGEKVKM